MPSKKSNKGRVRGRIWHKTNWREIFWEIRHPTNTPDEPEEEGGDEKLPALEPPGPVKRAKSESDQSQGESRLKVYLLTELASLVSEAQPGSFVILDIDETVLMARGSPSLLLTKPGVDTFRAFVHKRVNDWKLKNDLCQQLQKALKDKVPVTPTTASTIHALQANGVFVFGLTARYSELANLTEKELASIGVNLGLPSPFPAFLQQDEGLHVTVQNGVIYCNNQDKGPILKEVLERFVLREVLTQTRALAESPKPRPEQSAIPPEIFFIDDVYSNAASVCGNITPLADELGIVVSCYHYVPETGELSAVQQLPSGGEANALEYRILLKQVETFFEKQLVLSNEQAKKLLA